MRGGARPQQEPRIPRDFRGPPGENPGPSGSPKTQRRQPKWRRYQPGNRADRTRKSQEENDIELEELMTDGQDNTSRPAEPEVTEDSLSLLQRAMLFIISAIFGSLTEPPKEEATQEEVTNQGPDMGQGNPDPPFIGPLPEGQINPDPPGRAPFRTHSISIFGRIRNAIQNFLYRIFEIPVFDPPPPRTPPSPFLIPPRETLWIENREVERIAEPDGMSYTQRTIRIRKSSK